MAIDKAKDSTAFDSKLKSVADAIRSAGGTTEPMSFPSGMVEAITAIQAGSNIRVETGTVTFAEDTTLYDFVSDNPDILFVHLDFPEASINNSIPLTQYTYQIGCDTEYIYAFIQYPKIWKAYNYNKTKIEYDIGYASGTRKIYAVMTVAQDKTGCGPNFNGHLGAGLTYRYWAIYGVTVE